MPGTSPRPFNLTRWFSLVSLVCVASISVIAAILFSNFLTDKMLHRDAMLMMEFVQSAVRAEGAASFFLDPGKVADKRTELEATFYQFAQMPDVLRANIYASDRSIIWSSDGSLIGKKFEGNPELDEALAGELAVESGTVRKEEHVKGERALLEKSVTKFVEIYIPVRNDSNSKVIGAVEFYRTPDSLFEAIRSGQVLVWTSAMGGGLFFYAVLFWIVRRADHIMREQQQRLVETETLAVAGEMAAVVAHGIRNPLASIRSSAELALDGEPGSFREPAQDIIDAVDRMEILVRTLLSYARPVSSGSFGNIEINSLLRECLSTFARDMERRSIASSLELQDALPSTVGDAALLAQVVNSLIANALEAMRENGRLMLTSRLAEDRKHLLIGITDSGPGIDAAALGKIFNPFFTTKARGLGVGLPLAKRAIERFGGEITIASRAGEGTSVVLSLPVAA